MQSRSESSNLQKHRSTPEDSQLKSAKLTLQMFTILWTQHLLEAYTKDPESSEPQTYPQSYRRCSSFGLKFWIMEPKKPAWCEASILIHVQSTGHPLYLQSFASLGWITLPRKTWWNIFQTKSSDSRAPSLGALDRGRSWDLVSCHGFQANTTERGLCDCAVDTRFERKMQTSCKLSIRSLLLNWFLTMIWYLARCAMWVTKSGTSGRALLTRKPQASKEYRSSSMYCSPSYSGGFCLLIRYTGPSMLAFRHPGLDPSCCKKYATWHGKLMSQSQLNRIQGAPSEFRTTNLE